MVSADRNQRNLYSSACALVPVIAGLLLDTPSRADEGSQRILAPTSAKNDRELETVAIVLGAQGYCRFEKDQNGRPFIERSPDHVSKHKGLIARFVAIVTADMAISTASSAKEDDTKEQRAANELMASYCSWRKGLSIEEIGFNGMQQLRGVRCEEAFKD